MSTNTRDLGTANGGASRAAPGNPYIPALRAWDDVNGFAIARMKRSDLFAIGFFVLAVFGFAGMAYFAGQPRLVPYIVQTNKLDQTLAVARAEQLANVQIDPAITRAAIKRFIESLRTVTFDPVAQKHAITDNVRPFVASGSAAETFITEWIAGNDPFSRAKHYSVDVQADSPVPMSANTFQVDWTETQRDINGETLGITYWRGFVTVTMHLASDEAQMMLNPAGIYVTDLHWEQQKVTP